jgi:hypothetical protein
MRVVHQTPDGKALTEGEGRVILRFHHHGHQARSAGWPRGSVEARPPGAIHRSPSPGGPIVLVAQRLRPVAALGHWPSTNSWWRRAYLRRTPARRRMLKVRLRRAAITWGAPHRSIPARLVHPVYPVRQGSGPSARHLLTNH